MTKENIILEQLAIEQDNEAQYKADIRSEYLEEQRREDDKRRGELDDRNWNLN